MDRCRSRDTRLMNQPATRHQHDPILVPDTDASPARARCDRYNDAVIQAEIRRMSSTANRIGARFEASTKWSHD